MSYLNRMLVGLRIEDLETLKKCYKKERINNLRRIEIKNITVYYNPDEIYIIGTNDFLDIWTNIQTWRSETWEGSKGRAHSGFLRAARDVHEAVKHLPDIQLGYGHSLGGAVVLLLGLLRWHHKVANYKLAGATWGTPRVGDRELCDEITRNTRFTNYYHRGDVVTKVPLLTTGNAHPSNREVLPIDTRWPRFGHSTTSYLKSMEKSYAVSDLS